MNPFERLRQAIDKVNVTYQFQQDHQDQPERDDPVVQPTTISKSTNQIEIGKIKQIYGNTQAAHLQQINMLSSRVEQLSKQLKRSQATVQSQLNDIVSLEKENDLLKDNLQEQYRNIVAHDEKERKLKEQIYRINVTVNELAAQINAERNQKKQIIKELQILRVASNEERSKFQQLLKKEEHEKERVKAELEQRIEMFEYNVKKNADDRKQNKAQVSKLQQNYQKTLNGYRIDIDKLKQQLFESKKQAEILSLRKQNLEEQAQRASRKISQLKQNNKRLQDQNKSIASKLQESLKNNELLQQNNSSLGSELQEERKNIKVKVVEVKDQTVLLELDMYKRQCRQLMQQRAVLNSISRTERSIEPSYKVMSTQTFINNKQQ